MTVEWKFRGNAFVKLFVKPIRKTRNFIRKKSAVIPFVAQGLGLLSSGSVIHPGSYKIILKK